jgi:hypothetical protein
MSVILLTPDRYETIRSTVNCLRNQTVVRQLELIIVAPSGAKLELRENELQDFLRHRVAEVSNMDAVGAARAAGVRAASAPIVAFGEDHSFPRRTWAATLIAAHQQSWAAVGPVLRNANPASNVSWADFYIPYGQWADPTPAGEVHHLPGHNSSYKRDLLLEYGSNLDTMLEAESVLHWDLRRKGHRLYLASDAKTAHINFAHFGVWSAVQFHAGRVFAASRTQNEDWRFPRKLLFTLGSPLIPLVRFWRVAREMLRPGRHRHLLLRVSPLMFFGLVFDGAGQMFGYSLGMGQSLGMLSRLEFHRRRYNQRSATRRQPKPR